MTQLITTYDDTQHCTAADTSKGKSVAMDCPYTGKGEELSPGDLLEAALSGCMLMSMGAVATRDGIDLTDTVVEVELVGTPPPKIGYSAINVVVKMPTGIDPANRGKLERAADACPIKHSLDPAINVSVVFDYPDQRR
jgi:putative redox protein